MSGYDLGAVLAGMEDVMRNVVVGPWYDDPANDPGRAAVARLHDAERAMWRLYDLLGFDPGDAYIRPDREAADALGKALG